MVTMPLGNFRRTAFFFSIPISSPKPVFGLERACADSLPAGAMRRQGFSDDIGMRGRAASERKSNDVRRIIFLRTLIV